MGSSERIRKIVSEEINENMVSTCFITNLMAVSDMAATTIKGKHINGIVQELCITPYFYMNLHSEKQIKAIG